ncbi:hypothetical protein GN316_03405 [Xylophilus sp. Kf1]|nr:hypothetical protein [Xylophilus sp. Kf1]
MPPSAPSPGAWSMPTTPTTPPPSRWCRCCRPPWSSRRRCPRPRRHERGRPRSRHGAGALAYRPQPPIGLEPATYTRISMKKSTFFLVGLGLAAVLGSDTAAEAPQPGDAGRPPAEAGRTVDGWSVRDSILGKNVYTETGEKVGMVMDIIVDLDRSVSYLIVRAGRFLDLQRHDVAIATIQLRERDGRIVLMGADRETLEAMPEFRYPTDAARRDRFMARAQADIDSARNRLAELRRSTHQGSDDIRADIRAGRERRWDTLSKDIALAEAKLAEMRAVGIRRWKALRAGVSRATLPLREGGTQPVG